MLNLIQGPLPVSTSLSNWTLCGLMKMCLHFSHGPLGLGTLSQSRSLREKHGLPGSGVWSWGLRMGTTKACMPLLAPEQISWAMTMAWVAKHPTEGRQRSMSQKDQCTAVPNPDSETGAS